MPKIPNIFEQELRNNPPAPLEADFLDRLTLCADGAFTGLSGAEAGFEALLADVKPRALPAALRSSLSASLEGIPFAVDEKILLFHGQAKEVGTKATGFRRFNVAAAAAVAILGAAAGLMVPDRGAAKLAEREETPESGNVANARFSPAAYRSNLVETHDEGVIWRGNNQPHRVLRRTYLENLTMKNEDGKVYQVEQPHYEYLITPEKID